MCDDDTESEMRVWLAERALTRRELGVLGASAAALAAISGCAAEPRGEASGSGGPRASAATSATSEGADTVSRDVGTKTPDGEADGFFVAPARGRHPAVVLWPDVAGLRDAYRTMATRLAKEGYAVLAVNQYYRSSRAPVLSTFAEWRTDEGKAKLKPMIEAITPAGTTRDAAAWIAWLDRQAEVDTAKKVGSAGYCMGGPFTFRTAAAAPARVGAIASFHGGNLVNETDDSPHLTIAKISAALLVAIAQNDDEKEPQTKTRLREAADAAKRTAEITVYPAQHGWCTIDSPVYDEAQAEAAWQRMLAMFRAHL